MGDALSTRLSRLLATRRPIGAIGPRMRWGRFDESPSSAPTLISSDCVRSVDAICPEFGPQPSPDALRSTWEGINEP